MESWKNVSGHEGIQGEHSVPGESSAKQLSSYRQRFPDDSGRMKPYLTENKFTAVLSLDS
ncbi:MAG: hypothetical protein PHH79_08600, partial [Aminobacterium colombiense]|jgi:hypothetical protein|nr:hypothetical protein [Aminobacterium colombiense]